jgi:hypothetical protein
MGVVEIGCMIAPNHHWHCQAVPKHILAAPVVILLFFIESLWQRQRWGSLCSFQVARCC